MSLTNELPARYAILPNPPLNDRKALEQAPRLQVLVIVFLALGDLPSGGSYKPYRRKSSDSTEPGGLCVVRQNNIRGRALEIHYRENSTLKMSTNWRRRGCGRGNMIQGYGYICVRVPLQLSYRGVGSVGKKGWSRVIPPRHEMHAHEVHVHG